MLHLEQLDNNEAILLMYLAGELPEADQAEVEEMLSRDSALRAQLADLAALQDASATVLSQADAGLFTSRENAAARQFARDFAAFSQQPIVTAPVQQPHRTLRLGWFVYPAAAAAILVLGFFLIHNNRGNQSIDKIAIGPIHPTTTEMTDVVVSRAPVQILPDELERELISLRTDDSSFFDEK